MPYATENPGSSQGAQKKVSRFQWVICAVTIVMIGFYWHRKDSILPFQMV